MKSRNILAEVRRRKTFGLKKKVLPNQNVRTAFEETDNNPSDPEPKRQKLLDINGSSLDPIVEQKIHNMMGTLVEKITKSPTKKQTESKVKFHF